MIFRIWFGDLPGMYVDGYDLYVHLSGDADPNAADMAVIKIRDMESSRSQKSHCCLPRIDLPPLRRARPLRDRAHH